MRVRFYALFLCHMKRQTRSPHDSYTLSISRPLPSSSEGAPESDRSVSDGSQKSEPAHDDSLTGVRTIGVGDEVR